MSKTDKKFYILGYLVRVYENNLKIPATRGIAKNVPEFKKKSQKEDDIKKIMFELKENDLVELIDSEGSRLWRITDKGYNVYKSYIKHILEII